MVNGVGYKTQTEQLPAPNYEYTHKFSQLFGIAGWFRKASCYALDAKM